MPDASYVREFYNAYADLEWARLESAYGRLQAIIHTDFIDEYVHAGDTVLDVGCGPGRFSMLMAQQGARVTLVDISRRQLELARERLRGAALLERVDGVIEGSVSHLGMLPDGSFDVVVCYGGALSYAGEQRSIAAGELLRVTRPGGILLVSVMSRYGAAVNNVRRSIMPILQDPDGWHLWTVITSGDLPPFPSRIPGMKHPAMHLYTAEELQKLFGPCDILVLAGSNVSTYEGSEAFEELARDTQAWETVVELERRLCRNTGLVDTGSHIILAARKPR
jgi:ubiquinone/menaquinone biosynthesis C-methylase UbiE